MDPMTPKPMLKPKEPAPDDPALVLTHADMVGLSKLMKRSVKDRDTLLAAITSLNAVSVEGVQVTLEPRLLQRLKTRCLDKPNFPSWLAEVVVKQLHDFAGW
jgi:hypothetical protein